MTAMEITSLSLLLFSVLIIVLGVVKVHTYPGQVAVQRNHPQAKAIEVCSLLGLLVFPLWMAALIWAYAGSIGDPLPAVDETQGATADAKNADSANPASSEENA
jgi:hypothetical protein